jgi:hypothetical protein
LYEAWRWRRGEVESLGWLRADDRLAIPQGITDTGDVIVGFTSDGGRSSDRAFVWDRAHGMRSLADLLVSLGADLHGYDIHSVQGISDDGRRIVASLRDPADAGAVRSGLAILPPACADRIDNDGDGRVDLRDGDCQQPRDPQE